MRREAFMVAALHAIAVIGVLMVLALSGCGRRHLCVCDGVLIIGANCTCIETRATATVTCTYPSNGGGCSTQINLPDGGR
jgi:hypothetical protein